MTPVRRIWTGSLGVAATLLVAATALTSCSSDDGPTASDPAALIGHTYISTDVDGTAIPGGGPLTVAFPEAGRISANAGCNGHGGSVAFTGTTMTTGNLLGTLMACPPPRDTADQWVSDLFAEPLTWELADTTLTLSRGDQTVTLAEREDQPLIGTRWRVHSTVSASGVTSSRAITRAEPFIQIDTDGRVTGNAGCNAVTGTATVDGDRIDFSPLATTRKMCEPEITEVERAVLAAVNGSVTYRLDGEKLSLTNVADPALGLRLEVADD
ncbi:META domain-containing protein [Gordonia shandongensis]|uniref:META domain-containing protein n=1 Tax=Gordonia shandongensis TaxID=376351 RepID=UPI00047CAE6D|nr:META domain-containing protein [Gordonia shandongensis]